MSKPVTVWCVVRPDGTPYFSSAAHTRVGAIDSVFFGDEWSIARKQGYTVRKFQLVPVEKARGK